MKRLLLFDIDGTLTRSHNGHIPFNEAILKTFGVPGDIRSVIADGNTDPLIIADIFAKANLSVEDIDDKWEEFARNLCGSYSRAIRSGMTTLRALPGAVELLRKLTSGGILGCSVVTGNLEAMAQVKLEAAGLYPYLCRGAYGSDSPRRADLPAIAKQRWQTANKLMITPEDCIVIGDTPKDFEAARHNAMKCILIATGRYPVQELLCLKADACLTDLTDTEAVIQTLLKI
ncbi:MAG: HAD family hydrolase [Candidatus Binatia bacterium]